MEVLPAAPSFSLHLAGYRIAPAVLPLAVHCPAALTPRMYLENLVGRRPLRKRGCVEEQDCKCSDQPFHWTSSLARTDALIDSIL